MNPQRCVWNLVKDLKRKFFPEIVKVLNTPLNPCYGKWFCNWNSHTFFKVGEVLVAVTGKVDIPYLTLGTCKFCEIYKNTFFTKHLWATASVQTSSTSHTPRKRELSEIYKGLYTPTYLTKNTCPELLSQIHTHLWIKSLSNLLKHNSTQNDVLVWL